MASLNAILPIVIISVTGMVILIGDACFTLWRESRFLSAAVSLLGVAISFGYSVAMLTARFPVDRPAFHGAIAADPFAQACNILLLVAAALAILLAFTYLENRSLNLGEYYSLILFSTAGAMLMAAATDLIVLFVALETLSVALYVMAGFARAEARSEEAALKYFLLGAFAAGFLLYGIALIYGGASSTVDAGTTNLTALAAFLRVNPQPSFMLVCG
ncbi:MAG TPA: proton-conducting transporter membrane subunit, partial [Chthonomonadales bacterium]|nr:proton-conducting transporter membrane subunit [Chthonomonadales bacterium]